MEPPFPRLHPACRPSSSATTCAPMQPHPTAQWPIAETPLTTGWGCRLGEWPHIVLHRSMPHVWGHHHPPLVDWPPP